jgi:hypothetical protein
MQTPLFSLDASLDHCCYVEGDTVKCTVQLACLRDSSERIDWLAVQCCGFVYSACDHSTTSSPAAGSGTALHDETMIDVESRSCILNSKPQVVAAGLSLTPGQCVRSELVGVTPPKLPLPSALSALTRLASTHQAENTWTARAFATE